MVLIGLYRISKVLRCLVDRIDAQAARGEEGWRVNAPIRRAIDSADVLCLPFQVAKDGCLATGRVELEHAIRIVRDTVQKAIVSEHRLVPVALAGGDICEGGDIIAEERRGPRRRIDL